MSYMLIKDAQNKLTSLLTTPNRRIGGENGVTADVVFDYSHNSNVRITENPTESGVMINDHRIIQPRKISMSIGVSNTVTPQTLIDNYSKDALIQLGKAFIFGNSFDSKSRISITYGILENSMYNGELFELETPMGLFKNMLIIGIEETNDSDTIGIFNGVVTMQEFLTIDSEAYLQTTEKGGVIPPVEIGSLIPTSISDTAQSVSDAIARIF